MQFFPFYNLYLLLDYKHHKGQGHGYFLCQRMQHSCWCSKIFVDKMTGLALEPVFATTGIGLRQTRIWLLALSLASNEALDPWPPLQASISFSVMEIRITSLLNLLRR